MELQSMRRISKSVRWFIVFSESDWTSIAEDKRSASSFSKFSYSEATKEQLSAMGTYSSLLPSENSENGTWRFRTFDSKLHR